MTASNLDPKPDPLDFPDNPEDDEPDTVATPEGDAEEPARRSPEASPPGHAAHSRHQHQQAVADR
jgi:hypothetical protein